MELDNYNIVVLSFRARQLQHHHDSLGLSQPPGLSLRLKQGKDIPLPHRSLYIPDDLTVTLANEFNLNLK